MCLGNGVPTHTVRGWSSEMATALWSRAVLRLAWLFWLWSGISVAQGCGARGLPGTCGSPGSPSRSTCPVLGAALRLVTANVSKVRLGGWSRYHLCFPAVSSDLTDVGLDLQAFFQA